MRQFTFTLDEDDVDILMWLVEGNNAFDALAEKLSVQIDNQGG